MNHTQTHDEAILSHIPCGVIVLDRNKSIIYTNTRIRHLTGLAAQELIGKDLSVIGLGAKENQSSITGQEWWTWAEGATIHQRASIRGKDGALIPVFISGIRTKNGPDDDRLYMCMLDMSHIETWAVNEQFRETDRQQYFGLVGRSSSMQELYNLIDMAGDTAVTVLIQGESGTGKELVASAIVRSSSRGERAFVRMNCAALSETLLESELFGHVKGAFTGAYKDNIGKFEAAHEGTILLDEIGDISPALQARLLRVLQERVITRVGDNREIQVDVRIIAATNRNLRALVKKKLFREDLFYRLNVFSIHVPTLGERKTDIPLLCVHFLKKFQSETGKSILSISTDAMRVLMTYCWPGNIRELENTIEHAFVVCKSDEILVTDLPHELRAKVLRDGICEEKESERSRQSDAAPLLPVKRSGRLNITAQELTAQLERHEGNKSAVARSLGISKVGLWKKMKKLGLLRK